MRESFKKKKLNKRPFPEFKESDRNPTEDDELNDAGNRARKVKRLKSGSN